MRVLCIYPIELFKLLHANVEIALYIYLYTYMVYI